MFSSFNTFSANLVKSNPIQLIIETVINGNFMKNSVTPNNTYLFVGSTTNNTTLVPGWSLTLSNSNILIFSPKTGGFYPTSNTNLPSGNNYAQTISFQTSNSTVSMSQSVYLTSGQHTVSFYASGRATYYTTSNVFSVALGGTVLVSNQSVSNANWTLYSYTYTPPSAGNYLLSLNITNSSGTDSSINYANFAIV